MKKYTVGIFCDSYFPMVDGVAMVIDNYARRLVKYMNVYVFVPSFKDKKIDDSIYPYKVIRCSSKKLNFIDYSMPLPDKKFKEKIENIDLDIVHIHSPFIMGNLGVKIAKEKNIPCIGTMHSQFKQDVQRELKFDFISSLVTKVIVNTFNKCDECWAVNKAIANVFQNDYGYKYKPLIFNNATEMVKVDKKKADDYINKLYNLSDDTFVFLFVGRINKLKNIFLIVDSLKIFKENNKKFKFKMLFVGSGQDEEDLKKHIKKENLSNDIIMCGKITDRNILAYYYARSDLFLFPSWYDTNSLVQIEAASQNTPTLFIKGSVTASEIIDKETGYLSNNNPFDYANKINEIINDKICYNKVCKNVYQKVYKNWDDVSKKVYDRYLYLIERGKYAKK